MGKWRRLTFDYQEVSLRRCELGGSRTHNRLIRSQGLYPIELLVHCFLRCKITTFFNKSIKKCEIFCGGGWTRTTELIRGQIYSLLQLPLCDSPKDFLRCKITKISTPHNNFWKIFLKFLKCCLSIYYRILPQWWRMKHAHSGAFWTDIGAHIRRRAHHRVGAGARCYFVDIMRVFAWNWP